jgi:hypothetical protein
MESTLDLLLVGYKRIWHLYAGPFLEYESQALVSFKKYMLALLHMTGLENSECI